MDFGRWCRALVSVAIVGAAGLPVSVGASDQEADALPHQSTAGNRQEGVNEKMQNLTQSVLNKDLAAVLAAREIGPAANRELLPLTRNPDAKVRRIALYCLNETGGKEAGQAFTDALLDDDDQVVGAALEGLRHHPKSASPERLLQVYDRAQDPATRQQIMLIVARFSGEVDPQKVRMRYDKEKDPAAREGGLAALAQLKDMDARNEFVRRLQASSGPERLRFLDYCEWLHDPWLLRPLQPLLGDTTAAIRVGTDARPDLIQSLRTCDVVVNLVASITQRKFSFPVNDATNYNAAQLDEVKAFIRASP